MVDLRVQNLRVVRDERLLLDDVSFVIDDATIGAIIGPSGAGKTTALRVVAGLDPLEDGRVLLGDTDVTGIPTQRRDVAMVFQTAWLQPHLDVAGNVGFPLRVRGTASDEVDRRVEAEARAFSIRRLLGRRPRQLSAGERHAAATAHALVRRPRLLLLDEPMAQIDRHRRTEAIRQIATVQAGYGVTTLMATNDPVVAASLASRLIVLVAGRVQQVGTFQQIYDRPAATVAAELLGDPSINLLPGSVTDAGGQVAIGSELLALAGKRTRHRGRVQVGIRPEHLDRAPPGDRDVLTARVVDSAFAGSVWHVTATTRTGDTVVAAVAGAPDRPGATIGLRPRRLHLFDAGGAALLHVPR